MGEFDNYDKSYACISHLYLLTFTQFTLQLLYFLFIFDIFQKVFRSFSNHPIQTQTPLSPLSPNLLGDFY